MKFRRIGLLFACLLISGYSLHANNSKSDVQVIKNDDKISLHQIHISFYTKSNISVSYLYCNNV